MKIVFEVPGEPQGKGRARAYRLGNYIKHYTPENTANYENWIKTCFVSATEKTEWDRHTDKGLRMGIVAMFSIPRSFSRTNRKLAELGHLKPLKKPDIDNICKVVCDALNKVAYPDDKCVVELAANKAYGLKPKLIVELEEIS